MGKQSLKNYKKKTKENAEGARFFKQNIVGLEVEVEFAHMYKNQPLFSDVDVFVREKLGLELWDISKVYWKYQQKKYQTPFYCLHLCYPRLKV